MKRIPQYYDPDSSLREDIEDLGLPQFSLIKHAERVNDLVMNVVIKYLGEYLGAQSRNIQDIRTCLEKALPDTEKNTRVKEIPFSDSRVLTDLADLQATAAIFKEVAFGGNFMPTILPGGVNKSFTGVDLVAGSGVLIPAMAIAAMRKECNVIELYGFKIQSIIKVRRALHAALKDPQFLIKITEEGVGKAKVNLAHGPLHYVASGTLGSRNVPFEISPEGEFKIVHSDEDDFKRKFHSLLRDERQDPFPMALTMLNQERPELRRDVLYERTAMFPDIIRGMYRSDIQGSSLKIATGKNPHLLTPLSEIGNEFAEYEGLINLQRWPDPRTLPKYEWAQVPNRIDMLGRLPDEVLRQFGVDPDELRKWN